MAEELAKVVKPVAKFFLGAFSSIQDIELSNNLIGGSIPNNLPNTLVTFFLSDNKLTGNIPSSLSSLSSLSAMSLNNNELTGENPDAFEGLTLLVNLDLSSNNLSGELPPSMGTLPILTTLHLQNNQLSGTLDVLQAPPLKDLDIQNNLFSGPIPVKLLSIPNFRDALNVQVFLKMYRSDYAEKQLKIMQQVDDDHTLTQLANAWVNLGVGDSKIQEAYLIFQDFAESIK